MVRVERNLYERLVNISLFGRNRRIGSPSKFFYVQPTLYMIARTHESRYHVSFFEKLFDPVLEFIMPHLWWNWQRGIQLQRGLVQDDVHNFNEFELRRGIFLENVLRESCHPYQWLFYRYRRLRYYKIERTTQGFFVPEYIRKEVEKRTFADSVMAKRQWENFTYLNFYSDLTPSSYFGRAKLSILDHLGFYGLLRDVAWERYFLNEDKYDLVEDEDMMEPYVRPFGLDLETEDGRRLFEDKINSYVSRYPGLLVPEGEKFDFKLFYAWYAYD